MSDGPCATCSHSGTAQGADPKGVEGTASGKGGAASSVLRPRPPGVPPHSTVLTAPASSAGEACLLHYLGLHKLPQTRPRLGEFGLGLSRRCHVAALVAPPPPCLPEAENRSSYPGSAAPSSAKRKERAYLEKEFGHEQAAAARHVIWLRTG